MRLQRFCCCCNLRTGSLVIGTAGWVLTFIELFYLSGSLVEPERKTSLPDPYDDEQLTVFTSAVEHAHRRNLYTRIGYGVASLIVCVLLIVGVYKKDKRYMLPWLVLKCFEGIIVALGVVIIFSAACIADGEVKGVFFALSFIFVIVSVLTWYTWLCVYSHYHEVGEGVPRDGAPEVYYSPPPAMGAPAYPNKSQTDYGFTNPPEYNPAMAPPAYQEKSLGLA